jgi:hypothetical protein
MNTTRIVSFEDDVIDRLARIESNQSDRNAQTEDHEKRLRSVERRQWIFAGAAAALGPVLAKLGIHFPIG